MQKTNFQNQGQGLIGIIIVLVVVSLITGGLYYYFLKKIPEVPEITEKPAQEVVKPEEITPKRLFGKNILTKLLINHESLFILGTTNDNGNIDWKTILTISSIAKISPILIIENKKDIDDFSPKLFIKQYSPSQIYLHNYNYNFPKVKRINPENINSQLYESSNFVVISNGNSYETSLTAASFAAYFNIPIFFSPLNNNEKDLIKKWEAEKIGIGIKEDVDYSLAVSEVINILKKNSDYLVLTTSDDLNKLERPRFSLAAPVLAGGRNGLLLNIKNPTRESVKLKINELTKDGFSPSYLVVVGSEKNFPFIGFDIVPPGTFYNQDDDHQYYVNLYYWANYNPSNEYIPDAAVGAITGYSLSDISSLIARSIFYDRIAKSDKIVYWSPHSIPSYLAPGVSLVESILDTDFSKKNINNFKSYSSYDEKLTVANELKDASVFIYNGHAWRNVFGNMSIGELPTFNNPSFIFAFGCATLQPWNPGTWEDKHNEPIISYEAIKKGAVGIFGAVEVWFVVGEVNYGYDQRVIVENALNMPIGDSVFLSERMFDAYYLYVNRPIETIEPNYYSKRYIYLLGDPKLKVKTSSPMGSNIFSDKIEKIQMNFNDSMPEKMVCIPEKEMKGKGWCILCKFAEKECTKMLEKEPDEVIQFNFPILLNSYVYSTDATLHQNTIYFRMRLSFFTESKIRDINVKGDGKIISFPLMKPIKNLGQHCFYFNNRNYCPNLILYASYGIINPITGEKSLPQYLDIFFVR